MKTCSTCQLFGNQCRYTESLQKLQRYRDFTNRSDDYHLIPVVSGVAGAVVGMWPFSPTLGIMYAGAQGFFVATLLNSLRVAGEERLKKEAQQWDHYCTLKKAKND